jgi:hypothetical protein
MSADQAGAWVANLLDQMLVQPDGTRGTVRRSPRVHEKVGNVLPCRQLGNLRTRCAERSTSHGQVYL